MCANYPKISHQQSLPNCLYLEANFSSPNIKSLIQRPMVTKIPWLSKNKNVFIVSKLIIPMQHFMITKEFEYLFLLSCNNTSNENFQKNLSNLLSYSLSNRSMLNLITVLVNYTWNMIHCLNTYSRWVIIGAWRSISQFWCTWEAPDGRKAKIR